MEEQVHYLNAVDLAVAELEDLHRKALAERDAQIDAIRAALHHWRCSVHERWCAIRAGCPCICGCDETNAAREAARKAAGLED